MSMRASKVASVIALAVVLTAGCSSGGSGTGQLAPSAEIKIGAMLALSGEQAYANSPISNALTLAAEQINAAGGIDGHQVKVVLEDSKGTPQDGTAAFNKLTGSEGINAILGVSTPVIAATLPLAERNQKLLLDISTVGPKIWKDTKRSYSFSIYPKADVEMAQQAHFAASRLKATKAAVLAVNTETGQASSDAFTQAFTSAGGTITGIERYPANTTDFRPFLEKVDAGGPDVVSLIHNVEGGTIVRQAKEDNLALKFIGYSGSVNDQFLELAGGAAEGVYASTVGWNPNDPAKEVQDFITNYKARFNQEPTVYAAMGYDGVHILAKVIAKVGDNPKAIADELKNSEYTGATGLTKIGADGLADKKVYIKSVRGGAWVDDQTNS
jgi:branched-chain amino acid transport system substrate-binding protein